MTPGARAQAAIEVLDDWQRGTPPEQALTRWARRSRYAGSKDRAAVRDLVYDAVRAARSHAALGCGTDGRAMVLGGLRAAGIDPDTLFDGARFAPAPLVAAERVPPDPADLPEAVAHDLPDWLVPVFRASLGAQWSEIAQALRRRAPVFLRANLAKGDRERARALLAEDGIIADPHALATSALIVTEGARRVHLSRAYKEGVVELQDAASQALVEFIGLAPGARVLDYCAGGGGKSLALAALGGLVTAHDADPGRMGDIPARAARAGVEITRAQVVQGSFDVVLVDAPCSGSGAWRRAPQGKWALTPDRLDELVALQGQILDAARAHVAPGGTLAYATCSLFEAENDAQMAGFLARHPGWRETRARQFTPLDGADGFFVSLLERNAENTLSE